MRITENVAWTLLGLLFVVLGSNFFFNFIPLPPQPPEGTPFALTLFLIWTHCRGLAALLADRV